MRPVCVLVHEQSVRFSHALSVDGESSVVGVVVRTQCEALDALLRVLAEHSADDATAPLAFAACAEYGLTAVLPMLTVHYEPRSLAAVEETTQCRTLALNVVERLLRPVATLAPSTFVDVLWIVTGYVATPVTASDAASLRALRAAAVQCAHALLAGAARGAAGDDVCALLVAPLNARRRVAFLLSQLLAVAADTHDREVCELALASARLLLRSVGADDHEATRTVREQFLAWCFPGVASAATRAALGDYKVGYRVRCEAVALLTDAVSLLLTDARTGDVAKQHSSLDALRALVVPQVVVAPSSTTPAADGDSFLRSRSPEWLSETGVHLNAMLQRIFAAIGAESDQWADGVVARVPWQLRECLVTLAELLLVDCGALLSDASVVALLDCVVVSAHHEQPRVADAAVAARERVRSARADVASLGAIQRSVQRQATALPRIFHAARVNDDALLASLRLTSGYIELLPRDANALLVLRDSIAPMIEVLVELLEIDLQSAVMSELRPTAASLAALELERDDAHAHAATPPSASDESEPFPRCRYRRLHDERVAVAALGVCRLLGERTAASAQLQAILEQLIALLQDVRCVARSGAAMLAVATVEGAYSSAAALACTARVRRAATMLSESIVESVRDADAALLVADAQALAALIGADAASQFASDGDRSDALDAHVMRTLHSLLDMLAHEHAAVQQSARAALQRIARLCGVADVRALVRLNADYVIDCACRRIRHEPELQPSTARILLSVMRHSDSPAQLSLLVDAVESVSARLVRCDSAAACTALELLAEFAGALWRVARATAAEPLPPRLVRVTAPLAALLPRAIRSRSPASRVAALALTARLVGALKVAHDRAASMAAGDAAVATRDADAGAKLLPTVHDVWSSLVPRLDDGELAVSLAALHVLATLADVAGAFLRSRVADNVVPALRRALLAYGSRASPVPVHSSQHKRTLLALESLGVIARRCELPPATLASIGALARDVAQQFDWRDTPDVAARLKSLQTDVSAPAAHAAR